MLFKLFQGWEADFGDRAAVVDLIIRHPRDQQFKIEYLPCTGMLKSA